VDGDGDLDAVVGESGGTLRFYENTGSGAAAIYVERTGTANPFGSVDVGFQSAPSFADLDLDGDKELVLGDSVGTLSFLTNTSTGAGGNDVIVAGNGNNIVVGGFGNDVITTGTGADIVLGDNGAALYTAGTTRLLQVISTGVVGGSVGNDTITAGTGVLGEGNDLVIGGVGVDTVTSRSSGVDLVMGDDGQINWTPTGQLSQVATTDLALGAGDVILVGEGNNIVAGGVGADRIETGSGADLVLGDNGLFQFTTDGLGVAILTGARTTDTVDQPTWGDTIVTGDGNNVVLAGVGADHVNDPAVSTITQPSKRQRHRAGRQRPDHLGHRRSGPNRSRAHSPASAVMT
jgi:Ca2+-binding RTX toxin-like protein